MKIKGKITHKNLSGPERINHHNVPRLWIVVADKRIARIFRKTNSHLELIGEALPTHQHRAKGMPDNSMGRVTSLHGSHHHKLTPHIEPGRSDAIHFAQDLSSRLGEAVQRDSFDRLVLIATPRTLGDIRPQLHKSVQDRIIAEVNKDLTKMNERQLEEELKDIIWF